MECLICYQVVLNPSQCQDKDPRSMSTTICKLLDIPQLQLQSTFTTPGYLNSSTTLTLCPNCSEKMTKVGQLFDQLDEIQADLYRTKNEVIREMMKSEDLSQSNGNHNHMDETRSKIVQEIVSRNTNLDLNRNLSKQLKVEKDNQDQNFLLEDEDFLDTQENCNDLQFRSEPATNFNRIITKEIIIILEPIPLPKPNIKYGDKKSFNINSEPIKSFILRDRKRIKSSRFKVASISTTTNSINNSKVKKRRKGKIVKNERSVQKAKNNQQQNNQKNYPQDLIKYCSICDKHFKRPFFYRIHARKHTGELPFACDRCEKRFRSKSLLIQHLIMHGIGEEVIQCHLCPRFYSSQTKLDDHVNITHLNLKLFLCEICSISFKTEAGLSQHRLSVHLGRIFKCPHCDASFKVENTFKEHVRKVHLNELKYPCLDPNCNKLFLKPYEARVHNERVHLKIRPFKCDVCHKGFVSKTMLDRHRILHTGIRDFSCHVCGESFAVNGALKLHIQRKHMGEEKHLISDVTKRRKVGRRFKVAVIPSISIVNNNSDSDNL